MKRGWSPPFMTTGRDLIQAAKTPGLGLLGMTERVRALHGQMFVSSDPGSRTSISLELPTVLDASVV